MSTIGDIALSQNIILIMSIPPHKLHFISSNKIYFIFDSVRNNIQVPNFSLN